MSEDDRRHFVRGSPRAAVPFSAARCEQPLRQAQEHPDIRRSANAAAPNDSRKHPAIIAFKTGDPFQRISLVKSKRPDERADKNPVKQLAEYACLL